ncbi:peroxide operon regulator stress regulator [Caudoviricetes sp.]|nr:peroxide operon regulator stress regulator [Caudoviricetes sp.]UOF81106.1 peroxide operon regulator stress regulator [Caudoviricetes sp.]UOF82213.1 peroxide operon regulator stress regulator [Caudoviricetes sp.]UOF82451.1 peroxide operon regulator stress regulator [Caudoviricetes sp.]UOF82650.1 peroxide operon regulator stress regulator [Caudoviricetes sp.]
MNIIYPPNEEGLHFYPSESHPHCHGVCKSCREYIFVPLTDGVCPSCSQRRSKGVITSIIKRSGNKWAKRKRGLAPSIVRKSKR